MKIKTTKLLAVLCTVVMLVTTIIPSLAFTASAAATTYKYTFTSKQFSANGSKTLGGVDWTLNGNGNYWGYDGTKGQQFGSGNAPYKSMTLTSASFSNVTKITIATSGAKSVDASFTVSVGGTQVGSSTKITTTSTTYSFNPTTPLSGAVQFSYTQSSSKALYIKSITIEYGAASVCDHTNTKEEITPATCTTAGSTTITCKDCGDVKTTTIPALGHTLDDWSIVANPTCTDNGSEEAICSICGETQSKVIPAKGHIYEDGFCAECGEAMPSDVTITFDDVSKRKEFDSSIQVWEENGIIVTNNKTSESNPIADYSNPARFYKGSILIIALSDGLIEKIVFNCNNNNEYATALKSSIETKDGVTVTVSSDKVTVTFATPVESLNIAKLTAQVRVDSITVSVKAAHEHTPGAAATCTEDQICTTCREVLSKATGHTPGADATCTEDQICTTCREVLNKAPGHTPGAAATCTEDQICTTCREVLNKATGHTPGATATCTEDQICTTCREVLNEATGHTAGADATCTTAQTCTVCGAVLNEATGHSYDDGVYTAPTVDADGYTTYTCGKCGYEDVKTNEGTQLKAVAQIGEQRYASLQAAIDAANAGDEVVLLANVNGGAYINKAITINGEGFTITGTVTVEGHKDVVETVKFVNVKFFIDADISNNAGITARNYTEIFFENCNFTTNSDDRYHNGSKAIVVAGSDCTVEVKNCTASKLYYMIYAGQATGTLNIDGCTMTEMFYGIGSYRCAATIKNTTYSGYSYGIYAQNINTTLDLENVTINASHSKAIMMAAPVGSTGGTYIISLTGDNYANGAEMLVKADSVWLERENAEDPYQIKHDGKHATNSAVEENRKEPTCTTEGSYDKVYYCDNCGVVIGRETLPIPAKGHSYEAVVTAPTYVADGYTTYTCACGDTYQADITSKLTFKIDTNVIVGETFDLMFGFSKKQFSEAGVVMVELYAASNPDEKYAFTVDQLGVNGNYYTVSYEGLFAYQMCDEIVINVYDNNGNMIGTKSDTIQAYAMRMLDKADASAKTVFVDLLVYGAAAQEHFAYNTSNLATKDLTEAQMEYASELKALENKYDNINNYSKYYRGSQLVVGSHIQFQLAFKGGAYATVSYTNYLGKDVVYENIALENKILTLDFLSAADARETLTITVFNEDGSVYVELNESIESYCARNLDKSPAFAAFMKFADSAKAHLAPKAAN